MILSILTALQFISYTQVSRFQLSPPNEVVREWGLLNSSFWKHTHSENSDIQNEIVRNVVPMSGQEGNCKVKKQSFQDVYKIAQLNCAEAEDKKAKK